MPKAPAICAATLLAAASTPAFAETSMPEMNGTWESIACELRPQAGQDGIAPWYLKRSVIFGEGRIDAHFTTFADANCTTPLLELKFGGDVIVQGPSTVADRAMEVDLIVNDYLTVTPQMDGFAGFLNSAEPGTCGTEDWTVGTEQDVFATGCSVMGVAANTPTSEYEVLHVSAGHLYFGARPVDGVSLDDPELRPTALQMPLKLMEGGITQRVGEDDLRVPTHVEIVLFEQADGADPEEVRAFFEAITEKMNQNDTLLYRTVGQGDDGTWLCVNYWTNRPDMETLNQQAQSWSAEFATMGALVKPESFRLTSYATGL
ncbi:MAG: hypothetical protein OXC60_09025 [Litoreibacter sp.]|nr:hypothetical protein [Litoreibacter sp.]